MHEKHATHANKPTQKRKKENTYAGTHINTKVKMNLRHGDQAPMFAYGKRAPKECSTRILSYEERDALLQQGAHPVLAHSQPPADRQTDRQIERENVYYF